LAETGTKTKIVRRFWPKTKRKPKLCSQLTIIKLSIVNNKTRGSTTAEGPRDVLC